MTREEVIWILGLTQLEIVMRVGRIEQKALRNPEGGDAISAEMQIVFSTIVRKYIPAAEVSRYRYTSLCTNRSVQSDMNLMLSRI